MSFRSVHLGALYLSLLRSFELTLSHGSLFPMFESLYISVKL